MRTVLDKAICLEVSVGRLGTWRRLSSDHVEADTDKALLRVGKDLLDSGGLWAVADLDRAIRRWRQGTCLPSILRARLTFDASRELTTADIFAVARATTPLSSTMREAITALRE